MFVVICLFFIDLLLCIWNPFPNDKLSKIVFWLLFPVLIFIVGLRGEIDNDYVAYKEMYAANELVVEPTFIAIRFVLRDLLGANFVFLILTYAIVSIALKFKAIERYSNFVFLSLAIWMGNLMIVQDMTQIRAAVACGILLLSLGSLYERNKREYFCYTLMAVMFHFSAMLMLLLWFLSVDKINKWFWTSIVVVGYVLSVNHIYMTSLLSIIPINMIQSKLAVYDILTSEKIEDGATIFGLFQMTKLVLFILLLVRADYLAQFNKYVFIMLKIMACGIVALPLFRNNIVAGLRITEFLTCIDILLYPMILYLFPVWRFVGQGIVISYATSILYGRLFIEGLLK